MTLYKGSCHCGAISFTFEGEIDKATACNCSYCRRKGHLLTVSPMGKVKVDARDGAIGIYRFNKHVVDHVFCKMCGVGIGADFPDGRATAVNVRYIPAIDLDKLTIEHFDGASS